MAEGSGVYGDGYTTTAEIDGKLVAHLTFERDDAAPDAKPADLTETQRKQLCYKSGVDKITWEPSAELTLPEGRGAALVWRGKGTSIKKTDWGALVLSAVVAKKHAVSACGGYDLTHAELERRVAIVLGSLREGAADKTDPGNP
jgi:hypothetical protein